MCIYLWEQGYSRLVYTTFNSGHEYHYKSNTVNVEDCGASMGVVAKCRRCC